MFFCVKLHLTVKSVNNLKPCVSPGAGPESIVRAELCGDSRGASSSHSHAVLLQALQRSRPVAACRQHRLRLQGQPGHLPAGWFHTATETQETFPTITCVHWVTMGFQINFLAPQQALAYNIGILIYRDGICTQFQHLKFRYYVLVRCHRLLELLSMWSCFELYLCAGCMF